MDNNAPAPMQGTAPLSTTIDVNAATAPAAGNGGRITDAQEPSKPESVGDSLRSELTRIREEEAKDTTKPEKEADKLADEKGADKAAKPDDVAKEKPEDKAAKGRGEDGKFQKKDNEPAEDAEKGEPAKAAAERAAPDERQSEGRKHSEPPARFLPEARSKWANVPNEVKAEIHRVSQEHEAEVSQYRQSHESWQKLAKFDQMAKQHNTSVDAALEAYTTADGLLKQDFGKGIASLAQTYGHQPAQAIAAVLQGFNISPQQYADFVMKNPQAASQAPVSRAPDPVQRANPELTELRREIDSLKAERHTDQVTPIIQAFAAGRTDFPAVWPHMEKVIVSGVIDQIYGAGLSPEQKLAEAYRMAGGNASPSRPEQQAPAAHSAPANDRPVDPAGQKSIRGAPNGGQEPDDDVPETDIRALLRKEMRKAV